MELQLAILLLAVFTGVRAGEGLNYAEDVEFLQWSSLYYQGKESLADIYPVWRRNADFVREHNSLGLSYSVEMNKFGHMVSNALVKRRPPQLQSQEVAESVAYSIPDSVDWRKKGVVPPVENQGECGSSQIIAIAEVIDSFVTIKTGRLVDVSEQELNDCCLNCTGCSGGVLSKDVYKCIVEIGGLSGDDYFSKNCVCHNNSYTAVAKINGGKWIQSGNETALAVAVAMQPVAAAIDAGSQSFELYTSGIYDNPDCSSVELDHMVLIVGYGSQDGKDYWIVQNSWGTDWGMDGYILMSRNKNNQCGIASFASYPY